jgi:hypothetical protein
MNNTRRGLSIEESFWTKVDKCGPVASHVDGIDCCWVWKAYRDKRGYGRFSVRGKRVFAHRFSWELANGSIPPNMFVLHRCDNPGCVRASHLFIGTHEENMHDMVVKGRSDMGDGQGSRNSQSLMTEPGVEFARRELSSGVPIGQVAKTLGVSRSTMAHVLAGRSWPHVPWPEGASFAIDCPTAIAFRGARKRATAAESDASVSKP